MGFKKNNVIIFIFLLSLIAIGIFVLGYKNKGRVENKSERSPININAPVYKQEDIISPVKIINKEMVQIRFSWEIDGIKYNDAINIEKSQYEKMTEGQIEKLKKERFENWVNIVNEQSKQENNNEIP